MWLTPFLSATEVSVSFPKIHEGTMATSSTASQDRTIESDIPARLDRLPWASWHSRIILALGTSWLLDGLEVTLVGSLSGLLESKSGLQFTDPPATGAATTYLAGARLSPSV